MGSKSTARSWSDLVSEGRRLASSLSEDQWSIGDLALEVESVGERGGAPTGAGDHLRDFAELIGVGYNSLREYRSVANAWPIARRLAKVPWSVHQVLRGLEDRVEVIGSRSSWTVREAQAFVAERRAHEQAPAMPTEIHVPSAGVDAQIPVTWRSVDEVLRRHLGGHPELLRALRRELLPFWSTS